ncbi:MAG: hypothetical protein M1826_001057 [Phylliscum demangeonii]|nr:MAG: hypothetical protein M1826_001057 [Phylliscum demangeonii]
MSAPLPDSVVDSTLLVSRAGLDEAKALLQRYQTGDAKTMTAELWRAKKIVDSTLHPDSGQPVLLPFRMSCFVPSNLVVTAGMLTPGLGRRGILLWQMANQSLNVAINSANANQSTPLTMSVLAPSFVVAVGASCAVALGLNSLLPRLRRVAPGTRLVLARLIPFAAVASAGALNVFVMRAPEIRHGIDVYPVSRADEGSARASLGKSRTAAWLAVAETALSRVLNATPIMVLPPLILLRLQRTHWLQARPRLVLPVNLGLILTTSIFALPLALAAFPQRQSIGARRLEERFWGHGGQEDQVEFNRGI